MPRGRRPQAIAEEFGVVTLSYHQLLSVTVVSRYTFEADRDRCTYWDRDPLVLPPSPVHSLGGHIGTSGRVCAVGGREIEHHRAHTVSCGGGTVARSTIRPPQPTPWMCNAVAAQDRRRYDLSLTHLVETHGINMECL